MATTITEIAAQFFAGQARTNSAGAAVDDVTGEDLRLIAGLFSGGVVMSPTDAWQVRQRGAGANMSVDVGSGDADADYAVVEGTALGQGNYVVRKESATINVTVPAAHVSSPRIDEVYLVVYDNAYDASSRVLPRLAYRDGTPAGSPVAPGPDAAWDAYLLLATVSVPAGDTAITDAQITDERVGAESLTTPSATFMDSFEVDGSTEVASIALTGSAADAATVSLTIPTDWGSWRCSAFATFRSVVGSASDSNGVRIRIDGTDQQELIVVSISEGGAVGGRRAGITTTGARSVILRARENVGSSGQLAEIYLYARAVRTS